VRKKKKRRKRKRRRKKRKKNEDRGESENSEQSSKDGAEIKEGKKEEVEETVITLRPLTMEDLKQAKNQISPSFASEGVGMNELKEWNELYGEGGSRKKQSPTYFL